MTLRQSTVSGGDELPAILIGGALVANGRYPRRDELAELMGLKTPTAPVALTEQIKELVALGAAIAASCEPCSKFHFEKGQKLDLSPELMREAIQIGEAVKAASAKNVLNLAETLLVADAPKVVATSCCGGSANAAASEPKSKCC